MLFVVLLCRCWWSVSTMLCLSWHLLSNWLSVHCYCSALRPLSSMATLALMLLHIIVLFCFSFPALFDAVSRPRRVFDWSNCWLFTVYPWHSLFRWFLRHKFCFVSRLLRIFALCWCNFTRWIWWRVLCSSPHSLCLVHDVKVFAGTCVTTWKWFFCWRFSCAEDETRSS